MGIPDVFPYLQSGTPATDEYQAALVRFAPQAERGVGRATGWVTAKLFEKAAAGMPEPPTTEAILRGLWSIRGETLGGLTQALSFYEGRNAPIEPACAFTMAIRDQVWISPDGFQLSCAPRQ